MTVIAKIFAPLHEVRLQRHFIILAITAYILQTAAYALLYSRTGLSIWHLSQYSLWVADIILLPIVLFLIMWFTARRVATRTERFFKAFAWTTVGLALQTLLSLVYRMWLQRYLPYDGTHWYESWSILHPSVATIVVVVGAVLAVRYIKRISLAVCRVAASLAVLGAYAYSGVFMFRDTLHHYVALSNAFYFGIGALALGVILFTNYLLTTKEQDSYSERLYASTVYVMIGGFIFTILGGIWTIASQLGPTWVHASGVNDILVLTALLLYSGVLFWHKRQLVI